MADKLRNRLSRIRNARSCPDSSPIKANSPTDGAFLVPGGWLEKSPGFWHRTAERALGDSVLDGEIPLVFFSNRLKGLSSRFGDLVFFDLETTGLSGGTGTVAFLAAFGSFSDAKTLRITQYFIDDYPAEKAFVDTVNSIVSSAKVLVSYNGLCFDIPLFKTRCILNRTTLTASPPHVDLVYAARRVWKKSLPERSLSRVEKEILSIERHDDIPGRLVPEIWLNYVRTGAGTEKLKKVFTHNEDDIFSLARLLMLFLHAAQDESIPLADSFGHAVMLARIDPPAAIVRLRKLYDEGDARALKLLLQMLRKTGRLPEYLETRAQAKKNRMNQESDRSPS